MKNTKERILETALNLFNSDGLSQVTLRTIADKMGISQGNLNYHYKKREFIIESLYFQLVSKIEEEMFKNDATDLGLATLFSMSSSIMKNFFDYRFFMLDFVQIMRENEIIKAHYLELSKSREEQFSSLFDVLIRKDILLTETLENEYFFLYKRFEILGNFWISSAEISTHKLSKKMIVEYSELINQAIFPYLTDKGRGVYFELSKNS
ncbi:TetR/AcrR family transcriptional regulator [Brumimicrobium mesophilum]|uniref:TetR/AcrR family transcriptional regulator n=1 Tax=Brumimicrobium mesophilum TaxID=392717 RepID=UPI000D142988|nr:TetR/AcrR family transcriptional regulator [Brumimicrobium mesophilum]